MSATLTPYLHFEGRCEEALAFYKSALGARVGAMMRYSDAPPSDSAPPIPPGSESKIMHATFSIDGSTDVLASDGLCSGTPGFAGFSLSLTVGAAATAERCFAALADGGQVRMPLAETFFAPRFGMVADKFGIGWMVMVER